MLPDRNSAALGVPINARHGLTYLHAVLRQSPTGRSWIWQPQDQSGHRRSAARGCLRISRQPKIADCDSNRPTLVLEAIADDAAFGEPSPRRATCGSIP